MQAGVVDIFVNQVINPEVLLQMRRVMPKAAVQDSLPVLKSPTSPSLPGDNGRQSTSQSADQ